MDTCKGTAIVFTDVATEGENVLDDTMMKMHLLSRRQCLGVFDHEPKVTRLNYIDQSTSYDDRALQYTASKTSAHRAVH